MFQLANTTLVERLRSISRGNPLRSRLARASGASVLLKALSALLGLATAVVLARSLGPDGYGFYAYVLSIVTIIALPVSAGLPQVVLRETAKAVASTEWSLLKGLWRWATTIVLILAGLIGGLAALATCIFGQHLQSDQLLALGVGLALLPLLALSALRSASLRGLGKVVQGLLPEMAIRPLTLLILLLVPLGILDVQLTAIAALTIYLVSTGIAFSFGAYLLRRARPSNLRDYKPSYRSRSWIIAAVPMAAISGMHLINTQTDIFLVGMFMNAKDVGNYRVAVQVAALVIFGLQAVKMVVEPRLAALFKAGDMARIEEVATYASRVTLIVGLIAFFAIYFLGEAALGIVFGSEYEAAYTPLIILSLGWLAGAPLASAGHLLNMSKYEWLSAKLWVAPAVINIVLNLFLIPLWGVSGAASATAISVVVFYLLSWWAAWHKLGCDCSPFRLRRSLDKNDQDL